MVKLETYDRYLTIDERQFSKYKIQKIERKHLALRAKIKRLQKKLIYY